MKVYLAGPMRGIPEFNFPAFHKAAGHLRKMGFEVFSPAERDIERHGEDFAKASKTGDEAEATKNHGFNLREALRDDTHYICMEADAIAVLPGWENSKGAQAELALSKALGHKIFYLPESWEQKTTHSAILELAANGK